MNSELIKRLEELDEVIDEVIPKDKEHYHDGRMVNTRQRAKKLVKKISKLDPKTDKIKIQNLLSKINGIFSIISRDAKRKEFQTLYRVFEEVNPAWKPFNKLQMKIINEEETEPKEWLIVAKKMLKSILKEEINIDLAASCTSSLLIVMADKRGIEVEDEVEGVFLEIEALINADGPTDMNNPRVREKIKEVLRVTNTLLAEYN